MTGETPAVPPAGEPPATPPTGEPPATPPADAGPPGDRARVVVNDDLERSRLTVFFRFILVIPHLIVLALFSLLALAIAFINWFAILFTGKALGHEMQARYLRYFTHVDGYFNLAANPWPGFEGEPGSYPVDAQIPAPERQNRWKTAFRLILAVPALALGSAFGASGVQGGVGGNYRISLGIIGTAAFLGWFASVIRARMPRGLRDLVAYGLGYSVQVAAYMLLVTDRYPNSDPLYHDYGQRPDDHPIRISEDDDLRRSRLTVFFRLLLWLPHLVWLLLWGIAVFFTVVANWFVTLFAGRPADALHRFNGAYNRYLTHAFAYLHMVANPFPGFLGKPGTYPIDLHIAGPERQNRWKTGFRLILAIPAGLIEGALGNALLLVGVFGWFVGLILGRMPVGLRNLGVFALRYHAHVFAYTALLTDRYPFSGPSLELVQPESAAVPEPA
jgi:hypothetical protein